MDNLHIIYYPLSAIRYPLSAIRYPLSAIHYPLSIIRYPLSAIRYPLKKNALFHRIVIQRNPPLRLAKTAQCPLSTTDD